MYTLIAVSGAVAAAVLVWLVARHIRRLNDRIDDLRVSLAAARWRADIRAVALFDIAAMVCPPHTLRDARARATRALREEEAAQ